MEAQKWFEEYRVTKHKQLEEIRNACSLNDEEDIINIDDINAMIELLKQDDLTYSNDTIVDLICKAELKSTDDPKRRQLLENTRIAVNELYNSSASGQALQVCSDGSYRIIIGGKIYQALNIVSDYIGSVCMYKYGDCASPQVLLIIIYYNMQRIKEQKQNAAYIDNIDETISALLAKEMSEEDVDKYVRYTSEVFEVGLAFLIGHELGHHFNEDTQPDKNWDDKERPMGTLEDGLFSLIHSMVNAKQERELKADEYGYDFANEYVKAMYNTHQLHHVLALYAVFLASSLIGNPELTSESHPSIAARYHYIHLLHLGTFSMEHGLYIINQQKALVKLLCEAGCDFHWCQKEELPEKPGCIS